MLAVKKNSSSLHGCGWISYIYSWLMGKVRRKEKKSKKKQTVDLRLTDPLTGGPWFLCLFCFVLLAGEYFHRCSRGQGKGPSMFPESSLGGGRAGRRAGKRGAGWQQRGVHTDAWAAWVIQLWLWRCCCVNINSAGDGPMTGDQEWISTDIRIDVHWFKVQEKCTANRRKHGKRWNNGIKAKENHKNEK